MKQRIFILMLLVSAVISGCNEDTVTNNPETPAENNFQYPFKINTWWYYSTQNFVTNLRPDSISVYFPTDTLFGFGEAKFLRDTIIGSDTLRLMHNTHSDEGHSHTTQELYKQTDTGLIRIAFFSDGTNFGPYRPLNGITFTVHDKKFNSVNEIFDYYNGELIARDTLPLIFDDPPKVTVKYPIVQNQEWEFVSYGTSTRITKKYTDYENAVINGTNYYCIKIRRNWYFDSSPTADPRFISYDYFAKEGMVKRDFVIRDVPVSNQFGPIGYIDVREQAQLNLYIAP